MMTESTLNLDKQLVQQLNELHTTIREAANTIQQENKRLQTNYRVSNAGLAVLVAMPIAAIATAEIAKIFNDNPTEATIWQSPSMKAMMAELGVFVTSLVSICANEKINKTNSVEDNKKILKNFRTHKDNLVALLNQFPILDMDMEAAKLISNMRIKISEAENYEGHSNQTSHVVLVKKFALLNEVLNDLNQLVEKLNVATEDLEAQVVPSTVEVAPSTMNSFVSGKISSLWHKVTGSGYASVPAKENLEHIELSSLTNHG